MTKARREVHLCSLKGELDFIMKRQVVDERRRGVSLSDKSIERIKVLQVIRICKMLVTAVLPETVFLCMQKTIKRISPLSSTCKVIHIQYFFSRAKSLEEVGPSVPPSTLLLSPFSSSTFYCVVEYV